MGAKRQIVIGLDVGTTGCKAVAVTRHGRVVASAADTYALRVPQSGWAQQDVREVWTAVAGALRQLVRRIDIQQVGGIGLSGAMHSLLAVEEQGKPLSPALTWADNRAASTAEVLRQQPHASAIYRRTGCPLQGIYHPARLHQWMQTNRTLAQSRCLFVGIKDWVAHRLTGVWATDSNLASTTGLLDIRRFTWDPEALKLAGVTADRLPPLVEPQAVMGSITAQAAQETGLPVGLPVIAGGSDGGLANVGCGAASPGQVVITVGTSGAIRAVVDRPRLDLRQRTWCYVLHRGRWFHGGAINNAGLTLHWVRDVFYSDLPDARAYQSMMRDAQAIAPGADGLMMLPYLTGERCPHWDAQTQGNLMGLTLHHHQGHLVRAALEAVAFCLADVWEAAGFSNRLRQAVRLTGGATRWPLWGSIIADVLNVPLLAMDDADASAVGAAMLGQWGLGQIADLDAPRRRSAAQHLIKPDPRRHEVYQRLHRRFAELGRRLVFAQAQRETAERV